ncbi:hypothetical protein CSOJ01_08053 [Colletotrichum sojae]|uniref:Uncharacterized protein n=1 Tax=Colletotrichum sojae TaxID=2175907 RepID=A0A8H6J6W4_9PEZI|nr:hypothetical protein CSOJ01_08053 [Colletotrichum sojae]
MGEGGAMPMRTRTCIANLVVSPAARPAKIMSPCTIASPTRAIVASPVTPASRHPPLIRCWDAAGERQTPDRPAGGCTAGFQRAIPKTVLITREYEQQACRRHVDGRSTSPSQIPISPGSACGGHFDDG